jgi:hypothetical protein
MHLCEGFFVSLSKTYCPCNPTRKAICKCCWVALRNYSYLQDQLCPLSSAHSSALSSKAVYESGLGSSTCRANSSSLLHLSSRLEASPESGSPHSQGHSCLTTFQNGSEPSLDDQSAFHSVLSYASSTSVYEIESVEDCPVNKRKVNCHFSPFTLRPR